MRIWLDTEFQEDGRTIELISIGLVSADDRKLHLVNSEYDSSRASDWLRDNVLCHLAQVPRLPPVGIRQSVLDFVGGQRPEFWAYFGAYDWVVLQQLFGGMLTWPAGWPLICMDVEQWRVQCGIEKSDMPQQQSALHDALNDALWAREAWQFLQRVEVARRDTAGRHA